MSVELPPAVRPGDRVGVAALSGPVDAGRLERGMAELRRLGFEPVPAANLGDRNDLYAGGDERRLSAFHDLATDDSVAAIVFARGGHGALRLLPAIDWALLSRRPRAYVGYSDLTPFLLSVPQRLGFASFHGPMVAADLARGLTDDESASFVEALGGVSAQVVPAELGLVNDARETTIEAPLLGGCLSLLTAVLGTPWSASFDGSILLLEDVAEPLYRIDRMLTHLTLSSSLIGVRGLALGQLRGTDEGDEAVRSSVARAADAAPGRPLLAGLPIGHRSPNWTVPLGAKARLDLGARTLTVGLERDRR
jgi:muramoyltetrapeptide carboxypeptidase